MDDYFVVMLVECGDFVGGVVEEGGEGGFVVVDW